jgi:hypothetical protein
MWRYSRSEKWSILKVQRCKSLWKEQSHLASFYVIAECAQPMYNSLWLFMWIWINRWVFFLCGFLAIESTFQKCRLLHFGTHNKNVSFRLLRRSSALMWTFRGAFSKVSQMLLEMPVNNTWYMLSAWHFYRDVLQYIDAIWTVQSTWSYGPDLIDHRIFLILSPTYITLSLVWI